VREGLARSQDRVCACHFFSLIRTERAKRDETRQDRFILHLGVWQNQPTGSPGQDCATTSVTGYMDSARLRVLSNHWPSPASSQQENARMERATCSGAHSLRSSLCIVARRNKH
jgi:hypothetical protein